MLYSGTWMSQNELRTAALEFGINIFVFEAAEYSHWKYYPPNINWLKKFKHINWLKKFKHTLIILTLIIYKIINLNKHIQNKYEVWI